MKTIYLDATAGIAGDMTVAALLDLGVPLEYLRQELSKLNLPSGSFRLSEEQAQRGGMTGRRFDVHLPHHHHHHGHSDHHHHRSYADIRQMIDESALGHRARELSQRIFLKLAEAEALAHQVEVDEVQFHEVGAVDSIVDIVGTAICLDYLNVDRLYVSPVPLGGGFVDTSHGRLPVPAPATAELLKGFSVHSDCQDGERVTPTGAAIMAALSEPVAAMPSMKIDRIGHGAGTKDFCGRPNILRLFLGESPDSNEDGSIVECRCNLDDVTGEQAGYLMGVLFEAGALDVWHTAIQMKKNRPGLMISFLCKGIQFETLSEILIKETGTPGLRYNRVDRLELERRIEERDTRFGKVRFKVSEASVKPEYEDCRRIAAETGLPLREVQKEVGL